MEIETVAAPNWIYDFSDYQQMYDLTQSDFSKTILDFSAGISSFNAEASARGMKVISVDPAYQLSEAAMDSHARTVLHHTISQLEADPTRLQNHSADSRQKIESLWEKTEKLFLQDYATGKSQQRYQSIKLPSFPYSSLQFQLALCTDYVFHHALSREKVHAILKELARVAEEVRIFPLLDNNGKMPAELGPLMLYFQQKNYGIEVREVPYHTLKGGNAMLRIWEQECRL